MEATNRVKATGLTQKAIDNIKESGKYLGYPECCTDYLLDRTHRLIIGEKVESLDNVTTAGTGFVPCKSCDAKLASGEITIGELLKNRKCPTPFPKAHWRGNGPTDYK